MIFGRGYGRPGDELTWNWLNAVLRMARGNRINLGPNSGLSMVRSEGVATSLRVSRLAGIDQLAVVVSPGISARVTTTAGSGHVNPVSSTTGGTLTIDTSTSIAVLSYSSTTGGIPTGAYVWIAQDPGGNWFVISVDCGN